MPRELIITMTAANRVGIMSAVTKAMSDLGGDLRECSQTVVRGFFTMIFSADFPDSLEPSVIRDHMLDVCRPFDIDVGLRDPSVDLPPDLGGGGSRIMALRIGGQNKPGVLRKLSATIAMHRVDIAGMHAVRISEGGPFEMVLKIAVPADCSVDALLADLEAAGEEFGATAEVSDVSS
jgi:glycine cleavage system transcriptional repressor